MATKKNAANDDAPSLKSNRVSFTLTDEGVIDIANMRPSQREKFVSSILGNPEAVKLLDPDGAKAVGLDAATPEEMPDLFGGITEQNIRSGLDMLSSINARVFAIVGGKSIKHPVLRDAETNQPLPMQFDPALVARCFALTEEQHKELDPRALRIAQKHGNVLPEWLKKHLDIYMLCAMYFKFMGENALNAIQKQVAMDIELLKQRKQAEQATAQSKSNGHAAIRITEVPATGEGATA